MTQENFSIMNPNSGSCFKIRGKVSESWHLFGKNFNIRKKILSRNFVFDTMIFLNRRHNLMLFTVDVPLGIQIRYTSKSKKKIEPLDPEASWYSNTLMISVADPWHFGVDPDPRIHASDWWIWFRILLFSLLTFKMPTKKKLLKRSFSAYYFLKVL